MLISRVPPMSILHGADASIRPASRIRFILCMRSTPNTIDLSKFSCNFSKSSGISHCERSEAISLIALKIASSLTLLAMTKNHNFQRIPEFIEMLHFLEPQNIEQEVSNVEMTPSKFCGSLFCGSIFKNHYNFP